MEQQLSLEETAHFRVAIAARHSNCIRNDPAILWHAFHAVDAILSNLGTIQTVLVLYDHFCPTRSCCLDIMTERTRPSILHF